MMVWILPSALSTLVIVPLIFTSSPSTEPSLTCAAVTSFGVTVKPSLILVIVVTCSSISP